ncbi:hypothetical protein E3N88_40966 [Mikania micrantha]|uniref:Uncharacterized protein n=1 Tax=Mikania micrantha TaxID=192012 RepID=A0A5N6LP83_9ASTR|nr:hypothetical protein E3N88_40966 [Mikania micrantha]
MSIFRGHVSHSALPSPPALAVKPPPVLVSNATIHMYTRLITTPGPIKTTWCGRMRRERGDINRWWRLYVEAGGDVIEGGVRRWWLLEVLGGGGCWRCFTVVVVGGARWWWSPELLGGGGRRSCSVVVAAGAVM